MITKTVKKLLRRLGVDLVKWTSGYQLIRFPGVGEELSPLELIVPRLAATGDFYFVQIGANNGLRNDPLRSLILEYHLRGLLVEPLADMFADLEKNYASESQLAFENAAIAKENGELALFRFPADAKIPDSAHGNATFNQEILQEKGRMVGVNQFQKVLVPCLTFQALKDKHHFEKVSLLQVDTEGFDFEVIKMAIKSGVLPTLINYEFMHLSPQDRLDSCQLLADHGYSFIHGRWDTLAVRREELVI